MNTRKSSRLITALLVAATALLHGAPEPAEPARDNVVIVLDASGSMNDRMPNRGPVKMDAAKAALKQVLQQLPANTQVGLLVFSGANVPDEWVYPLGPRDESRLWQAIDRPRPQGATPLGAYLKKGADRLLAERERQMGYGTYRLLVVTDGEAQDQNLVQRYTPQIVARGITVDVIGVAMNQRHTLATKVHSYRAANDPQSLHRALAEVFAEVGGRTTDTADAEAFALLEPIPEGVALAAIQALSTTGNQPIGEQTAAPAAAVPPSTPPPQPPTAAAAPHSSPPSPSAPPPHRPPIPRGTMATFVHLLGSLFCIGVTFVIILAFVIRAARKNRR